MRRFSVAPGQDALAGLLDRIADHPVLGKETFERALELVRGRRAGLVPMLALVAFSLPASGSFPVRRSF